MRGETISRPCNFCTDCSIVGFRASHKMRVQREMLSRRKLIQYCGRSGAALLVNSGYPNALRATEAGQRSNQNSLSQADDQFLEDLEKANFLFFWEQADPHTG